MSITASVDINLIKKDSQHAGTNEILEILLLSGWTLMHDNTIGYIPLGDKECSNWQLDTVIKISDLKNIILEKEKNNEVNGLILTWGNTKIGGIFLFWGNGNLSLTINLTRKTILLNDNLEITDFMWYLEKLLPPLNNAFGIDSFICEEQK